MRNGRTYGVASGRAANKWNYKRDKVTTSAFRWHSPEFVALQKEWYAKLKLTGFVDLEFFKDNGDTTPTLLASGLHSIKQSYKPETAFYFRKASWYLHHGIFVTQQEQRIWELFSNGKSRKAISDELQVSIWRVRKTVRAVEKRMLADTRYEKTEAQYVLKRLDQFNRITSAANRRRGNENNE